MNGSNAPGHSVLNLPENSSSQINIMLHESHSTVFWPASLIVVADNIFVIGIRVLGQESLYQFSGLISNKSEHNVHMVYITHVHSDGMTGFNLD